MDAFSYLSVLISIILGLAVTQVLQGFRGLMLARSRVRGYWPALVWAVLVLVIAAQEWWAMYGLRVRSISHWTFPDFGFVLLQTVPVYLLAGLILPDFDGSKNLDLREHYYAHHRWFFSLIVLLVVIGFIRAWVFVGTWPGPLDFGFQVFFATGAAIGAWTAREWYHKLLAPLAAIALGAYILLLYTHLRLN
jgi:hypothetical protein